MDSELSALEARRNKTRALKQGMMQELLPEEPPGMTALTPTHATLVADLRQLIADARLRAAASVNAELTGLYWQVGRRIHREILGSERAEYGEEILSMLSRQLSSDYGRGFSAQNLRHMVRFAQAFPDEAIVSTLSRQLSWSHLKALVLPIWTICR